METQQAAQVAVWLQAPRLELALLPAQRRGAQSALVGQGEHWTLSQDMLPDRQSRFVFLLAEACT